jgi:hypothetical protein
VKAEVSPSELLLRALLAIEVADREDRLKGRQPRPTELILADAGLSLADTAALTGKNYQAVQKAVRRSRAAHPLVSDATDEGTDG